MSRLRRRLLRSFLGEREPWLASGRDLCVLRGHVTYSELPELLNPLNTRVSLHVAGGHAGASTFSSSRRSRPCRFARFESKSFLKVGSSPPSPESDRADRARRFPDDISSQCEEMSQRMAPTTSRASVSSFITLPVVSSTFLASLA